MKRTVEVEIPEGRYCDNRKGYKKTCRFYTITDYNDYCSLYQNEDDSLDLEIPEGSDNWRHSLRVKCKECLSLTESIRS